MSQNDDHEVLIQNFYTACKAETYGAFSNVNSGIQLFDTKQYSRSLKNFQKALKKDNKYCDAYYLIGYCYQKTNDLVRAIVYCDSALSIEPKNPSALIIKANTLFLKKDTATAAELFSRSIELLPEKVDGYYGYALMMYYLGNNEKARSTINVMDQKRVKTPNIREKKKIKALRAMLEQ